MRLVRSLLPLIIGIFVACGVLLLLRANVSRADTITLVQTTVDDFNKGTFYRTGMTRYEDGEVTLLRSGIAGDWITNINATGLVPRYGHAAIAYNNRLYVFGGRTGLSSLRSIQYAQINTTTHDLGNWNTANVDLPTSIYPYVSGAFTGVVRLSAVQWGQWVYLLGGENGDQSYRYATVAFASLDPNTGALGAFATTAPLPQPLSEGQAVVANDRIYYIAGRTNSYNQGTDAVYYAAPDPATGVITAWYTTTLPLPYKTYGHMSIATNDGRIYAMAGVTLTSFYPTVPFVYYADPLTTTGDITNWVSTINLPRNIFAGSAVYFGGQIYATGGALDNISNASNLVFTAFDESAGGVITWTATNVITPERIAHTAVINSDGWIYVIGGSTGSQQPIQTSIINAGATAGNSGTAYAGSGFFRSAEFDLVKNYLVTNLSWRAYLSDPSEMTLTVRYRYRTSSGSYSAWSAAMPSNPVAGIATTTLPVSVTARYVQYEADFSTTNPLTTPILYQMALTYDRPQPPQFVKSANPPIGSNVRANDSITYTIRFTNTTGITLNQVIVADSIPTGTTYVPGSIFASPGITPYVFLPNLTWDVGQLPLGAAGQVGFAVKVNSGLQDGLEIPNAATLDSDSIFVYSNRISHIAGVPPRLSKNHVIEVPGSVQPNDLITYTLTYSNPAESSTLSNVVISDTLPPQVTYLSGSPAPDLSLLGSAGVIRWTIASVPSNSGGSVSYTVRVNSLAQVPDGSVVSNIAQLSAAQRPMVSSNTDAINVRYRYDLRMQQTVDLSKAPPGSILNYTYYLTNVTQMPITPTGIVLTAYLEPGLPGLTRTYVLNCAAPCSGWSFVQRDPFGNQIYTRAIPPLGPNRSVSVTLQAQVSPTLPSDVLAVANYGEASDDGSHGVEIDYTNQSEESITTVGGPDIMVQSVNAPARAGKGRKLNVSAVLKNKGFAPALGPDNTGWFGVDLYVKPVGAAPPSGPADRYLGACPTPVNPCPTTIRYGTQYQVVGYPNNPLAPDQVVTVTFPVTVGVEGTYWLYVQADTYWNDPNPIYGTPAHGRIVEGDEGNNIFGPVQVVIGPNKIYLPIIRR